MWYNHAGTAGPFDTGAHAGANIQFLGIIPSPCPSGQYSYAQTLTRTRFRVNGFIQAREGETLDDVAESRLNYSAAPQRQEFLGGGSAPLGYIISFADPPSTPYGPTDTIEHDRAFSTSVVGPGGKKTVSWSLSTRIINGSVTRNDLS